MTATINTLGCVPSVYEVVAEMSLPEHLGALWENSIVLTFVKIFQNETYIQRIMAEKILG